MFDWRYLVVGVQLGKFPFHTALSGSPESVPATSTTRAFWAGLPGSPRAPFVAAASDGRRYPCSTCLCGGSDGGNLVPGRLAAVYARFPESERRE